MCLTRKPSRNETGDLKKKIYPDSILFLITKNKPDDIVPTLMKTRKNYNMNNHVITGGFKSIRKTNVQVVYWITVWHEKKGASHLTRMKKGISIKQQLFFLVICCTKLSRNVTRICTVWYNMFTYIYMPPGTWIRWNTICSTVHRWRAANWSDFLRID